MFKFNLLGMLGAEGMFNQTFDTIEDLVNFVETQVLPNQGCEIEVVVAEKPVLHLKKKWHYPSLEHVWEYVSIKPKNYPTPELPGLE